MNLLRLRLTVILIGKQRNLCMPFSGLVLQLVGWLACFKARYWNFNICIKKQGYFPFLLIAHKVPWDILNNYHPFKTEFYGKFYLLCHLSANNPCICDHEVDGQLLVLNKSSGFCRTFCVMFRKVTKPRTEVRVRSATGAEVNGRCKALSVRNCYRLYKVQVKQSEVTASQLSFASGCGCMVKSSFWGKRSILKTILFSLIVCKFPIYFRTNIKLHRLRWTDFFLLQLIKFGCL